MEFSLAQSLEGNCEILNSPNPQINADPAIDLVNPGLGQIVNLYETLVPIRGRYLHTLAKKVENNDEIKDNVSEQSNFQSGSGNDPIESPVLESFMHPIITDSIIFPKEETHPKKHKISKSSEKSFPSKRRKIQHKFEIV